MNVINNKHPRYWSREEKRRFLQYVEYNYHNFDRDELLQFAIRYDVREILTIISEKDFLSAIRRNQLYNSFEDDFISDERKSSSYRDATTQEEWNYRPVYIVNCIPVVSQFKSLGMILFDWNLSRAMRVQADFINTTTGVSQVKSIWHLLTFNTKKACMVQKQYFLYIGAVLDSIPVVGHFKALIHYMVSDETEGYRAFRSSTRSMCFWKCSTYGIERKGCLLLGALGGYLVDILLRDDEESSNYQNMYCKSDDDSVGGFEEVFDGLASIFPVTTCWGLLLTGIIFSDYTLLDLFLKDM